MQHEVVSRDEWLKARTALLAREKAFTKLGDELAAEQRALPWVRIDKEYVFDGSTGKVTLADLFGRRSQLFLKHFMMAPGQTEQCVGCSLEVDHVAGLLGHLDNNNVSYVAVARAPIGEIEVLKQRMGWRFPFVSAFDSDFNYDFNVSFTKAEVPPKARSTISGEPTRTSKTCPARACSTRTRPARSSTPILHSAAAASSFWASTATST